MSTEYHRHCQATVLSANGTEMGNGATWYRIKDLILSNLDDDWLGYFSNNKVDITQDIAGILQLLDSVAGDVGQITGRDINLSISGQTLSFHTLVQKKGEVLSIDLPKASEKQFGIVKIGSGIESQNGTISLKPATTKEIGGVKVGDGLTADENGVLSVSGITQVTAGSDISIDPTSGKGNVTISLYSTKEDWIFEALDGTKTTKTVILQNKTNNNGI